MKTGGRKLLRYAAGLIIAAMLMGTAYTTTAMASSIGLIDTADLLDIHAEADGSSDVVGQVMDEGHVAILARGNGWIQIKAGDIVGWVPEANLIETEVSNEEAHEANQKVIAELAEEAMEQLEEAEEEAVVAFAYEVSAANGQQAEEEAQRLEAEEAQRLAAEEAQRLATEEAQRLAAEEAQRAAAAEQAEMQKQAILAAAGVTEEDLYLLANIIYCEAGGEPYVGKVAVGNVVLNRVKSSRYPNTIKEVIYDKGQFSPVSDGNLKEALKHNKANESCYQAAMEALAGSKPVGDKLFFRRCNGRSGQVIGHHVFY